jgi:hypothetical protein
MGLRVRGIDVLTAAEDGAARADDEAILERALQLDRVTYTQDDDFLVLAHQWAAVGRTFAGVIYSRHSKISIGRAIDDLEVAAKVLDPAEIRNMVIFIPFA